MFLSLLMWFERVKIINIHLLCVFSLFSLCHILIVVEVMEWHSVIGMRKAEVNSPPSSPPPPPPPPPPSACPLPPPTRKAHTLHVKQIVPPCEFCFVWFCKYFILLLYFFIVYLLALKNNNKKQQIRVAQPETDKWLAFHLIFHHFSPFNCC